MTDPLLLELVPLPSRVDGLFLRGPVPWNWLERAMVLPGRALHVALVLWQRAGMAGTAVNAVNLSRLSVDRSAASRGLAALEAAGLVAVKRRPGRKPVVTILEAR